MPLRSCSVCHRHVMAQEVACPFCGTAIELAASNRRTAASGVKRAALFALGATLTATACSDDSTSSDPPDNTNEPGAAEPDAQSGGAGTDDTELDNAQPEYGAPVEPGDDTKEPEMAEPDDLIVQPLYGAVVAPDVAPEPETMEPDDLVVQPVYGAPIEPSPAEPEASDAGAADGGMMEDEDASVKPIKQDSGLEPIEPAVQPLYGAVPAPEK